MNNKITIGSRGSKLSLAYANKVKDLISNIDLTASKEITIETIKIFILVKICQIYIN